MFLMISLLLSSLFESPKVSDFIVTGPSHNNEAITCDLPLAEHLKNAAGVDGLGLCVFTSLELAARWQNETKLFGLRDYMTQLNGGGWPERVEEILSRFAQHKNVSPAEFVQHTGGDVEFLHRALQTGRYPCVTYDGRDGQFYKGRIAHMVNLAHLSQDWAVIQDNNHPQKWLWMKPADFLSRWRGTGGGWAIVLLKPGPPPIPVNRYPLANFNNETLQSYEFSFQPQEFLFHPAQSMVLKSEPPRPEILEFDNFGLGMKYLNGQLQYRLNGQIVSRDEALKSIGNIPDDRDRFRLTIIGSSEFQKKVLHELQTHPGWPDLQKKLLLQSYLEDHWAVTGVGLRKGITLQTPPNSEGKGAVLFRIENYNGPESVIAALRKADPNYKPERDPDPTRPIPPLPTQPTPPAEPNSPRPWNVSSWFDGFWAFVGCAIAILIHRYTERTRL